MTATGIESRWNYSRTTYNQIPSISESEHIRDQIDNFKCLNKMQKTYSIFVGNKFTEPVNGNSCKIICNRIAIVELYFMKIVC
jgi:hypothetical protein